MKKAFTLIELLVVIVIISILATLAIVGGMAARRWMHETSIKVMTKSLRTYVSQYNLICVEMPAQCVQPWDPDAPPAVKERVASLNNGLLIHQFDRHQKLRDRLREGIDSSLFKQFEDDLLGTGPMKFTVIMDGFPEPKPLNYLRSGGVAGTALVYSAGRDGLYDTKDDIRSDDWKESEE